MAPASPTRPRASGFRPDGSAVRWRLSVPRELGPERPPFLIEHDTATAEWSPQDRAERAAQVHPLGATVRLTTLELPIADAPSTIAALMRTVRIGPFRPSLAGGGTRDATVGTQTLRLRPDRTPSGAPDRAVGWPVATVHLVAAGTVEARDVDLLGCRFLVRAAP